MPRGECGGQRAPARNAGARNAGVSKAVIDADVKLGLSHLWPVAEPFVMRRRAQPEDIDGFGHVNNVRYIDWAMEAAWRHSDALGLPMDEYRRIGVGCVVHRNEFEYLSPVKEGEEVFVATWIADNDGRVRLNRAYLMCGAGDGRTIFRGLTRFVCVDMKTGRPARMPASFAARYRPAVVLDC